MPMIPQDREIRKLIWKDEGEAGPLWGVVADGSRRNFRDSDYERPDGGFFAAWYTLTNARKIAKKLGVDLEMV